MVAKPRAMSSAALLLSALVLLVRVACKELGTEEGLLEREDSFLTCVSRAATTMRASGKASCGTGIITGAASSCLLASSANRSSRVPPPLRFLGMRLTSTMQLMALVDRAVKQNGMPVVSWDLASTLDVNRLETSFTKTREYHAYIMTGLQLGDSVYYDVPQDLSSLVLYDKDLDWMSLLPFYREAAAVFDGRVLSVPVQGVNSILGYRRDLFAAAGLQPPRTWEEAIAAARHFNGTDLNGDGNTNDFGICMWISEDCLTMASPLMIILASLVQAGGTNGGLYFHPSTMKSVLQTRAWQKAVEIAAELNRYSSPPTKTRLPGNDCAYRPEFAAGRCAMVLTGQVQFKKDSAMAADGSFSRVRGNIGVALLPGSPVVLDWESDSLVPCNPDLCPYAVPYNASDLRSSTVQANISLDTSPRTSQSGTVWINRVSYAGVIGFIAIVNKDFSVEEKLAAYYTLSQAARLDRSWSTVASPESGGGPTRVQHFDPANRHLWLQYSYHPADLTDYLDAALKALSSKNIAMDMRSVGATNFTKVTYMTAQLLVNGTMPPLQIAARARQAYEAILRQSDLAAVHTSYLASINFLNTRHAQDDQSQGLQGENTERHHAATLTAALASSLACAAALAATAGCLFWLSRRHRSWLLRRLSRITPPSVGPRTTLCVTDIQDSTTLWERLSAPVMDSALRLHHVCLRRCATACEGYESATEGDSFILAFHSPQHALQFCLRAQEELLLLDWPQELLQEDVCRPVWCWDAPSAGCMQHSSREASPRRPAAIVPVKTPSVTGALVPRASFPHIALPRRRQEAGALRSGPRGLSRAQLSSDAEPEGVPVAAADSASPPLYFHSPASGVGVTEEESSDVGRIATTFHLPPRPACRPVSSCFTCGTLDEGLRRDGQTSSACGDTYGFAAASQLDNTVLADDRKRRSMSGSAIRVPYLRHETQVSTRLAYVCLADPSQCNSEPLQALKLSAPHHRRPFPSQQLHAPPAAVLGANLTVELRGSAPAPHTQQVLADPSQPAGTSGGRTTVGELLQEVASVLSNPGASGGPQGRLASRTDAPCLLSWLVASRQPPLLRFECGSKGHGLPSKTPENSAAARPVAEGELDPQSCPDATPSPTRVKDTSDDVRRYGTTQASKQHPDRPVLSTDAHTDCSSSSGQLRRDDYSPATAPLASPGGGGWIAPQRLLFRGLRVRMGCASGVGSESEVSYNSRMARTIYTGRSIAAAKAVANAAQGGMVLLGEATQALLTAPTAAADCTNVVGLPAPGRNGGGDPAQHTVAGRFLEQAWTGEGAVARSSDDRKAVKAVLWYGGCLVLDELLPAMEVYQAASPRQMPRWALLPAPAARTAQKPLAYGLEAAPVGSLAVAVVAVSGALAIASMRRDDSDGGSIWRDCALQLWHEAARLCQLHGGFLATRRAAVVGLHPEVMAAGGGQGGKGGGGEQLVLTAAFIDATEAVLWSAGLIARCLRLPWPLELRETEVGESLWATAAQEAACTPIGSPHDMASPVVQADLAGKVIPVSSQLQGICTASERGGIAAVLTASAAAIADGADQPGAQLQSVHSDKGLACSSDRSSTGTSGIQDDASVRQWHHRLGSAGGLASNHFPLLWRRAGRAATTSRSKIGSPAHSPTSTPFAQWLAMPDEQFRSLHGFSKASMGVSDRPMSRLGREMVSTPVVLPVREDLEVPKVGESNTVADRASFFLACEESEQPPSHQQQQQHLHGSSVGLSGPLLPIAGASQQRMKTCPQLEWMTREQQEPLQGGQGQGGSHTLARSLNTELAGRQSGEASLDSHSALNRPQRATATDPAVIQLPAPVPEACTPAALLASAATVVPALEPVTEPSGKHSLTSRGDTMPWLFGDGPQHCNTAQHSSKEITSASASDSRPEAPSLRRKTTGRDASIRDPRVSNPHPLLLSMDGGFCSTLSPGSQSTVRQFASLLELPSGHMTSDTSRHGVESVSSSRRRSDEDQPAIARVWDHQPRRVGAATTGAGGLMSCTSREDRLQQQRQSTARQRLPSGFSAASSCTRHVTRSNRVHTSGAGMEAAPSAGLLLPASALHGLLCRGPRMRAGVELGYATIEVCTATGNACYRGPAATGAGALALSAPVSHVQVSSTVACHVSAKGAAELAGAEARATEAAEGAATPQEEGEAAGGSHKIAVLQRHTSTWWQPAGATGALTCTPASQTTQEGGDAVRCGSGRSPAEGSPACGISAESSGEAARQPSQAREPSQARGPSSATSFRSNHLAIQGATPAPARPAVSLMARVVVHLGATGAGASSGNTTAASAGKRWKSIGAASSLRL